MKHLCLAFLMLLLWGKTYEQTTSPKQDKLSRYQFLGTEIERLEGGAKACESKIEIEQERIKLAAAIYGKAHYEYAWNHLVLAKSYFACNSAEASLSFIDENLKKYRKDGPNVKPIIPLLLSYKGYLLMKKGEYKNAQVLGNQAVDFARIYFKTDPLIYSRCLNNLGRILDKAGLSEKALPWLLEAQSLFAPDLDQAQTRLLYHQLLPTLGNIYVNLGQYEKALPIYLEALEGCKKLPTNNPEGQRLFELGKLYNNMGLYRNAQQVLLESANIIKVNEGVNSGWYGRVMHALGDVYHQTDDYKLALEAYQVAYLNYVNDYAPDHPYCSIFLSKIGKIYRQMGQYDLALQNLEKALSIAAKSFGMQHPEYAARLFDLAILYRNIQQNSTALDLIQQALDIAQLNLDSSHPRIGTYMHEWGVTAESLGLSTEAAAAFLTANDIALNRILWQFDHFSVAEQKALLTTLDHFFAQFQSFAFRHQQNTKLMEVVYNDLMAFKGLILGNRKANEDYFRRQASPALFQQYQKWKILQAKIARQSCLRLKDRSPDFDSIRYECNILESELSRLSLPFRENYTIPDWKLVAQALPEDAAAIEFAHFDYYLPGADQASGQVLYVAYLIRKDVPFPQIIHLFEESEIGQLEATSKLYSYRKRDASSNLHELIWQKLAPHLLELKSIYFAPSGMLHRVNFGAIPINEKEIISDRFVRHRLGSTRQLYSASIKKQVPINHAMLFGGIRYDSLNQNPNWPYSDQSNSTFTNLEPWPFLEWTEKEVDDLWQILKPNLSKVNRIKGGEATEERFKLLGGNSPQILHLATHGYFFTPNQEGNRSNQAYSLPFLTSNNPMIRSGLILANANYVWQRGESFPDQEDGVLTAYEVAQMDLTGTELVVLSACDTGLGDIEGNEGLYGLQRAFKLAGAKYLLMSLWNVNDVETYQFMITFYQEWIKQSQSIPDAYRTTQRLMRSKYPHRPAAWAGFILID